MHGEKIITQKKQGKKETIESALLRGGEILKVKDNKGTGDNN